MSAELLFSSPEKFLIDILGFLLVLVAAVAPRFNSWPAQQAKLFVGKPSDYIDAARFQGFRAVYIFTFIVMALAIQNTPQLIGLIIGGAAKVSEDAGLVQYLTVCGLFAFAILQVPAIAKCDDQWRQVLHEWARIPRLVQELKQNILHADNFTPTEGCLLSVAQQLNRYQDEALRSYWHKALAVLPSEKLDGTLNWHYLKCLCLMVIVRDACQSLLISSWNDKVNRLDELGRIVYSSASDSSKTGALKDELQSTAEFFTECICKCLIKKFHRQDQRYDAFKNLGFHIGQQDVADIRLGDATLWCLVALALVVALSNLLVLNIIDRFSNAGFFSFEKLATWTLAGWASFVIAVSVGVVFKLAASRTGYRGPAVYLSAVFVATATALFYLGLAHGLMDRPAAWLALALSYSLLSVVVIKALKNTSNDVRDIYGLSAMHGLALGGVLAAFQVLISLFFALARAPEGVAVATVVDGKLVMYAWLSLAGFCKGFAAGFVVSFILQNALRKQLLVALRQAPRVDRLLMFNLQLAGEKLQGSIKNLSRSGARIQCRHALAVGDQLELKCQSFGKVDGVVRWRQHKLFGAEEAGVEFVRTPAELHQYIWDKYGDYYVGA